MVFPSQNKLAGSTKLTYVNLKKLPQSTCSQKITDELSRRWDFSLPLFRSNITSAKSLSDVSASRNILFPRSKVGLEKPLQKPWTINVAQRWIRHDRDQSRKIKIELKSKRLLQRLIKPWRVKGWGIQYFEWPILVFIWVIRKNHEYTKYYTTVK